jgi:formiminotetrahydrofolate cyclodeaminase
VPIERTGVGTAAASASLALELLAKVIEVSKPARRDEWVDIARRAAEDLARAAEDDVRAYNRYLALGQAALRGTIEVPMKAARSAMAGIELCTVMADFVKASVAADLGVAEELLTGAARGILLCVDVNLRTVGSDPEYDAVREERRALGERVRAPRREA